MAWALGLGILAAVLSARGALSGLEWRAYDHQLAARAPGVPPRDIIVVMIDDSCLDRLGPWPWPMSRHADLVRRIAGAEPRAIVFDILFFGGTARDLAGRDGSAPLGRAATAPGPTPATSRPVAETPEFADALRDAGNVFLAMCFLQGEHPVELGPYGLRMAELRQPPPELGSAAAGAGAVNVFPERDGVVRSAPLVMDHGGEPIPSLALEVIRRIEPAPDVRIGTTGRRCSVRLGDTSIPLTRAGEMLISYAGGYKVFPWVAYDEVLAGQVSPERFRNRIVLVGFTATGLSDTRPTPLAPACPGVEINAHVMRTILESDFIRPLGAAGNALLALGIALALGLALPRLRPFGALIGAGAVAVLIVVVSVYLFQRAGLWINVVTPALTALAVGLVVAADGYRVSDREKIRTESSLGTLALATRMIAASTSRQPVLDAVREEITQLVGARQTDVYLMDLDGEELVLADGGRDARVRVGGGTLGRVGQEGVPLLTTDATADAALAREVAQAADFAVGPVAFIPLRRQDQVVGVVQVVRRPGEEAFGERDLELLNALSQEAAVALENVELYEKLEGKVEIANRELVKAYSQLALEKDRVEALLENMADAVIMTDTDDRVLYVNPAAERMFRVSGREVEGDPLAEHFDVGGLPAVAESAHDADGELVTGQVVIEEPKRLVLTANAALISDDQGRPVGVVTVLSDVTLLQEMSDMKTEFVSLVSHELRTPLTSVQGFAQTLRSDVEGHFDAATRSEFLEIIESECHRLLTMINELLDASRIEAGRELPMNWGQVSITAIADKLVKLHSASAEAHTFEVDFPADLPTIEADGDRIEQVLTNIISNAIKYSPDGGVVRISGRREDGEVLISVADHGLGMTEAQRGQLFQRYHRLESDASKRIRGTGLGLYLTKGLVEAHRGRIWAESEGPGKGSVFSFALPIQRPGENDAAGGA
ncbi:MAG: CHASE2 domain-containing protein [Armatimonadota bacterium]|nr:MAG: CHASE2 domain-containing protein [Armatimonadota bacterium]